MTRKFINHLFYLGLLFIFSGCAALGLVAYNPARNIKYMNISDTDFKEGVSMGEVKGVSCGGILFHFISLSQPTGDEAILHLRGQGVRYLKNVKIDMPLKTTYPGGVYGQRCITISGLGFK